jgi:alpha-L-rhamnosidase
VRDSQGTRGEIPPVCPRSDMPGVNPWHAGQPGGSGTAELPNQDGGPAWADAGVIVPHALWTRYGDLRVVERQYDSMRQFIDYLKEHDSKELIRKDVRHWPWGGFGDWLSLDGGDASIGSRDGGTPKDLIGTAYFARCCRLLAEMADALGKNDDAAGYRALGDDVAIAFRDAFVTPNGRMAAQTQTSYLLALAYDLLDEPQRKPAFAFLVNLLERTKFKLRTGFVGTPLLLPTLTRFGRVDLAYRVLLDAGYPGWLFTISMGASTMWERWNSWTRKDGFGPVSMNSFNHYAYGAVGEWMYETIGGLVPIRPGYKQLRIAPQPGVPQKGHGLTSARTTLQTPFGPAACTWTLEGDAFSMQATVPPNTTADLVTPDGRSRSVGPGTHHVGAGS